MILKAFKEKSNQKYINKLLSSRKSMVNNKKVNTIAVLLNVDEFDDFEAFRAYFKELQFLSPTHRLIASSSNDKLELNHWETLYSPKDFGWKGKLNNIDLKNFIQEDFDVLISYYRQGGLELDMITTLSKANFKVGLSRNDERLYDLIIDLDPKQMNIFKKEFKKYLNILNKI